MIVVRCSHGAHLSKKVAKNTHSPHSLLLVDKFPDDELRVRFQSDVKNKKVILVQSFYKNVSDCLIEVILAAQAAKDFGAKKVALFAPYFPYLRQDKLFRKGEAVSQGIIAKLIDRFFDEIIIIDPHLHRKNSLDEIFKIKTIKLTANRLIADYIRKKIKNPVVIGPDEESYKWARNVAELIGADSRILKKKRYSSFHVEVTLNKKIDLKDKNVVIVDDIISTGHTIIETAKILRKLGAKKIYCVCVHGIFALGIGLLKKNKIEVISTNTIPNEAGKIDVSGLLLNN